MGIKAAFLQGKELTRNVYIRPPREAQSKGTLWTLKKWPRKRFSVLLQQGERHYAAVRRYCVCQKSTQQCLLVGVMGVLACHVDDYLGRFWNVLQDSHPSLESVSNWTGRTQQLKLQLDGGSLCGGWNTGATMYVHKKPPSHSCGPKPEPHSKSPP